MNSFFKGTLLLMFVILLSKLLGFIYRMQFMRIAGEETVGMYMSAYPAFIFFIAVIQMGIPIAVSKLVAQYAAKRQYDFVQTVWKQAWQLSILFLMVFVIPLALCIPFVARVLLHEERMTSVLYVGLAIVPIVVVASLLRAYLQGLAKIAPTAWAQLLEQLLRIGLTITLLPIAVVQVNAAMTAAIAMAITGCGEILSLLITYIFYLRARKRLPRHEANPQSMKKAIFRLALPSSGSRLFGTFTWFLEPIVFLKALTVSGMTAAGAMGLYGVISGVHIPMLLFPSFIPNALAIVLIPAVSEAIARAHKKSLQHRIDLSLRASAVIGCFASTLLFLYGDELAKQLFHIDSERNYMQLLAPIFFFYYVQSPLHAILQAIDEARAAMMNSIYGGLSKLVVLFALASQPFLQEKGAIIAIGFGVLITSFLHIATLQKHRDLRIRFHKLLTPYAIFIIVVIWKTYFPVQLGFTHQFIVTFLITLFLLILFKQLKREDLQFMASKLFS